MVRRLALCLTLVTGLLLGCSKPVSDSTGSSAAAGKSAVEVKIAQVSRQFLTIEAVGATSSSGTRTYFGRTAFRPKALAAVTAPFAGRVRPLARYNHY